MTSSGTTRPGVSSGGVAEGVSPLPSPEDLEQPGRGPLSRHVRSSLPNSSPESATAPTTARAGKRAGRVKTAQRRAKRAKSRRDRALPYPETVGAVDTPSGLGDRRHVRYMLGRLL